MNRFGKFLLVFTSLSPILLAYAVNALSQGEKTAGYVYGLIGGGSAILSYLLLRFIRTQLSIQTLKVVKIKSVDKQALAFLLIYLLPLFAGKAVDFQSHPWTAVYVCLIIGTVVYHSNAFTFNPVFALLRYHFYEVETEDGMAYLLITRKLLRRQVVDFKVLEIADYVFMDQD